MGEQKYSEYVDRIGRTGRLGPPKKRESEIFLEELKKIEERVLDPETQQMVRPDGGADYVDGLLAERGKTHGDFSEGARTIQGLKNFMRRHPGWEKLSDRQKEVFDMLATKMGRILCGSPNNKDHWDDCAGYSKLAAEECK